MRFGRIGAPLALVSCACLLGCAVGGKHPQDGAAGSSSSAGAASPRPGAAGSAGAPAASASGPAGAGAYVDMGAWHGYAFTSASGMGSSIEPADFEQRGAGQALCARGTVTAAADYSGIGLVGFNLNQATSGMPATITPSKDGVRVALKNNAGSMLRVQLQGPNGATDKNQRWCAPITGSGGFIPYAKFNSACWDGSGSVYAKQPLVAAMVLVPGGASDAVRFDFCLQNLTDADGAAANSSSSNTTSATPAAGSGSSAASSGGSLPAGNLSGSGTISDKYGSTTVMRDGRSYVVQNNVWGDNSTQSLKYDGTTFEVTQQSGMNMSSGAGAMGPVSYPSVFIGANYQRSTAGSNLPKQISALKAVKTGWSYSADGVSGTYNAAYDVWFSTGASGDSGAPSGGFLMVWYYRPPNAQPIGTADPTPVTIPGVSGTWEVWLGQNNGHPCISYVRTQPISALEFDLTAFIADATARPGAIQKSWYLSNVFAGFEIWSGGVGLKTTSFYATVE